MEQNKNLKLDDMSLCNNMRQEEFFTSRLQKGGALLEEVRLIVSSWPDHEVDEADLIPWLANQLSKTTKIRVKHIFQYVFRPRFLNGSPSNAWRLARVLEDLRADQQVIRPFYYWITARAEAPLYNFVTDVLYSRNRSSNREVRTDEVVSWLASQAGKAGKSWSLSVTLRVALGILAALRDFGILEGSRRKRIASVSLVPEACALIAFCLHDMGISGRELIQHLDWRLFLLGETGVEHLFLECHQHGWFHYESAGNIYRIDFPRVNFEEFAHVVLGRNV